MNVEKEIQELDLLSQAYYNGQSLVSDSQWDERVQALKNLNPKNNEEAKLIKAFLQRVGSPVQSSKKIKHDYPMLSLNTLIDQEDNPKLTEIFDKTTGDENPCWVVEYKLDGLGLSLVYDNGKLIHAATRGDGQVGEDVTDRIQFIRGICKTIPSNGSRVVVRGEVVIAKESEIHGYNNRRNAAAGILRGSDTSNKHLLVFVAYDMFLPKDQEIFKSQKIKMEYLENIGFQTPYITYIWKTQDLVDFYKNQYDLCAYKCRFETDGLVVKIDSIKRQQELGSTAKYPKWSFALKKNAQFAITTILDIQEQEGKTGKVTPVAYLAPVNLGTITVSKINLYSRKYIHENKIEKGKKIMIKRAGGVIPVFKSIVNE